MPKYTIDGTTLSDVADAVRELDGNPDTMTPAQMASRIRAVQPGGADLSVIADDYDTTATYDVGDYCIHEGGLYVCTTAISTAEAWTAGHWEEVTVGDELSDLKSDLRQFNNYDIFNNYGTFENKTASGVTFAWSGQTCTVTGTATAGTYDNIIASMSDVPAYLTPGKSYRLIFDPTDANIKLELWKYVNGSSSATFVGRYGESRVITIPEEITGIVLRLFVASGSTVNGSVTPKLIDDKNLDLRENVSAIDTDLTEIHAELDTLSSDVGDVSDASDTIQSMVKSMIKCGCIDWLDTMTKTSETRTGISFAWNKDGSCHISGTATAATLHNIFYDTQKLPNGIEKGKTYRFVYPGHAVTMQVWVLKNGSYSAGFWWNKDEIEYTIPLDAEGMLIRFNIPNGTTVDTTVHPQILTTYTTDELLALIQEIDDSVHLEYRGIYPNASDISDITETGIYLLTGNTSAPTAYGTLFHIQFASGSCVQIIFRYSIFNIYYRRCTNSTWYDWQNTDARYGGGNYLQSRKYIAFGDSLMYGALWNGTPSDPVITQASLGARIPDRICNALSCDVYENLAVGGMAYTIGDTKFIDWIKSKDISGANLITIAGGRNDGPSQLGTSSSASGDGTICGAIKEIIEYIRQTNPSCQIVVIQVTPYTSQNAPFTSPSSSGWTLNDFDAQVKVLCSDMNVGYASWYGCSLFSRWSDFSGGGGNWAHMKNEEQYIQMGNFIAGQVGKYYHN